MIAVTLAANVDDNRPERGSAFDSWEPIAADDEAIRAALEHANVPALLVALAQHTGDLSLLRGGIRPRPVWGDAQMGLTEAQQEQVRARAQEILAACRDGSMRAAHPPARDQVHEMASFLVGQAVGDDYVEFLVTELGLAGHDPGTAAGLRGLPAERRGGFHVAVIGAGMSGILAAHRLQQAGIPYTVLEKNADVGGTWLENTYPGCRVDTPNHAYSYSFVPQDWPQFFSSQPVLLDYFARCATEFGIRDRIRFGTEVEHLRFDDGSQTWTIHARNGSGEPLPPLRANAVISAVGQLNRPRLPDIPGRETFRGAGLSHRALGPRGGARRQARGRDRHRRLGVPGGAGDRPVGGGAVSVPAHAAVGQSAPRLPPRGSRRQALAAALRPPLRAVVPPAAVLAHRRGRAGLRVPGRRVGRGGQHRSRQPQAAPRAGQTRPGGTKRRSRSCWRSASPTIPRPGSGCCTTTAPGSAPSSAATCTW